jgi:glycolate oxidase FAD binding subunit
MVVTVEAGTTLAEIDRELAAAGQRLAIEAPHPEVATIGGVAAANYSHGLAFRFGSPRDQILGMTVVDGCGRVLRAGGRVVKNVAGYDLPRILIGSFGTLAVITDVTLRTQPRPEAEKRFVIDCDDEPSVDGIRQALFVSRLPLSSFEIVGQCDGNRLRWRLHLTTEGTTTEVESVHASIAAIARERGCGTDATAGTEEIAGQANYVARFATTPSNAIREASILLGIARGTASEVRAHLECGGVLLRLRATCVSDAQVVALAQACRERSAAGAGALLLERMPHEQKRSIDVWCGPIHGVALMRRLKARFDPYAVLAPGRFVGGI